MNNDLARSVARTAASFGLLFLVSDLAHADMSVSTGVDYSSGTYGATEKTKITYIPLIFKYEADRYFIRFAVPYLSIEAPTGGAILTIGPDGQPIREASGARATNAGMGDVIVAAGYTVMDSGAGALLDVIGKIKFGTADETKGLGTGENDYSAQLDWSQKLSGFTLLATGGYRVYGDPPGTDFDNAFFGSLGGVRKFAPATSGGLIFDFRENIVAGTDSQRDVTAFVSHKIGKSRKLQGYASAGLSDASPDWGIGVVLSFGF